MFIEVVIESQIVNRVEVKADLPITGFNQAEFEMRQRTIDQYLHELRAIYQKADFQLAFESKLNKL